jgi:hypothetical protein
MMHILNRDYNKTERTGMPTTAMASVPIATNSRDLDAISQMMENKINSMPHYFYTTMDGKREASGGRKPPMICKIRMAKGASSFDTVWPSCETVALLETLTVHLLHIAACERR